MPWLMLALACTAAPTARESLARERATSTEVQPTIDPSTGVAADTHETDAAPADVLTAAASALEHARSVALAVLQQRDAAPDDAGTNARAARALSNVADLTLLAAQVARFQAHPASEPGELVRGEDDLDAAVVLEIEGLVRDATRFARAAIDSAARTPELDTLGAHQDEAFAESLTAWAIGPTRALVSGAGSRLPKLLAANRALGAEREGAAPLRLEGRFLCLAPWPVGDRARGRELLDAAVAAAPTPLNALFQGDAAWLVDDVDGAQRAWELACAAADARPADDAHARLVGALARMRLAAQQ